MREINSTDGKYLNIHKNKYRFLLNPVVSFSISAHIKSAIILYPETGEIGKTSATSCADNLPR